MEQVKILFQPPLGTNHGFSFRSAYTDVNGMEFVGSGVADDDATAHSKALSELVERISINKRNNVKQITVQYVFDDNKYSLTTQENCPKDCNDDIFSSACRSDIADSINDAIVEMHERIHLEIWCELLINNIGSLNICELAYSEMEENIKLSQYINSFRPKIFLSWASGHNIMPSFVMIGNFNYGHKQIMVASSGKTIASAIHKGLLDIAKILVVEEHAHLFSKKPKLFHNDSSISRFCDISTAKMFSNEQLMEVVSSYKEQNGRFKVNCIESDFSNTLNLHPVFIARANMKELLGIDDDYIGNSGNADTIRRYFS